MYHLLIYIEARVSITNIILIIYLFIYLFALFFYLFDLLLVEFIYLFVFIHSFSFVDMQAIVFQRLTETVVSVLCFSSSNSY